MSDSDVCPPQLNSEIAGIGVRVSFYFQALILALLSARSDKLEEVATSLYTLVMTNVAMITITFLLGFKKSPNITLQDAIVVLYLLSLSSVAIYFSTVRYDRFPSRNRALEYLSVVQSYLFFGLALAVLVKGNNGFGMLPPCNNDTRVVIFRPFDFLTTGRTIFITFISILMAVYTVMTAIDYIFNEMKSGVLARGINCVLHKIKRRRNVENKEEVVANHSGNRDPPILDPNSQVIGTLIYDMLAIFILWPIVVVNTELLLKWNRFKEPEESPWQFGQILALFLVVLPLTDLIKAFLRLGLGLSLEQREKRKEDNEKAAKNEIQRREPHTVVLGNSNSDAVSRLQERRKRRVTPQPVYDEETEIIDGLGLDEVVGLRRNSDLDANGVAVEHQTLRRAESCPPFSNL